MEEDTVELVDYLRVIWKRKGLIIVGTLVCIVAAWVVSLRLPEIYRAEVLVSIGKILASPSPPPSPLIPFATPETLVESIPVEYGLNDEGEAWKYHLNVKVVSAPSLIKLIMEGPGRSRVKELLKGVVNRFIDGHLRKTESFIQPYRVLMGKMETDIKIIQQDISQLEAKLKKVNIGEVDSVVAILAQNNLWQMRSNLRDTQEKLLIYQSVIDSLKEYKTKVIGRVTAGKTPVKPKTKLNVMIVGVVSLTMFILLAFFIEYLGKVREREKKE